MEEGNIVHQNTQREVRKKNSKVKKGGYQGFMAEQINSYSWLISKEKVQYKRLGKEKYHVAGSYFT